VESCELRDCFRNAGGALLRRTRNVHRPRAVAEVASQLAQNRGDGGCCKPSAPIWVKPIDGLHEGERGDLDDGPSPGTRRGLAEMAEVWRDWLSAWEDMNVEAQEYRELA
jgi:hypothetical protein